MFGSSWFVSFFSDFVIILFLEKSIHSILQYLPLLIVVLYFNRFHFQGKCGEILPSALAEEQQTNSDAPIKENKDK